MIPEGKNIIISKYVITDRKLKVQKLSKHPSQEVRKN